MSQFFAKFPIIPYQISRTDQRTARYDLATNIMVRVRVLTEKLDQIFHYYEYTIKDGETPEILAEKYYGDPEAHWLVLLTNNRTDPQYDWPLNYDNFNNYIIGKYGSIAIAQTTYHHYEKILKTFDATTQTETNKIIQIVTNPLSNITVNNAGRGYAANGNLSISTDYGVGANVSYRINSNGSIVSLNITSKGSYVAGPNLSISGANTSTAILTSFVATGNLWSSLPTDQGSSISNTVGSSVVNSYQAYRNSVTNYDWEFEENEKKRLIKLIKPEYYGSIKSEFDTIMAAATNRKLTGIRTVT